MRQRFEDIDDDPFVSPHSTRIRLGDLVD